MSFDDLQIVFVLGLIVLLTTAPVFAWAQTRKLALLVLLSYVLFLAVKWDFVAGPVMPIHDTGWNLEGWSALIQQWIYSGQELGWMPYIGGGQPMALYNNTLSSIPSVAFAGLFKALGLPFSPTQNFKLIWIFGHLNICTGSLLFFRSVFRENWVCLVGFVSMLFGGYFFVEWGQGVGIYVLSFLPYLLFFLIWFYRERTWTPFLLFWLLLGISVNYYNPTYMIYTLILFLVSLLVVNGIQNRPRLKEEIRSLLKTVMQKPWALVLAGILFAIPATPMLNNFVEMRDFISPTRGFSSDQAKFTQESYQTELSVPFEGYQKLVYPRFKDMALDLHTAFYIGILPCLAVVASLVVGAYWVFLILSLFLILIAAPDIFGVSLWGAIRHYLPFGETIRHTFLFGRLITFFLLTASLAGLLALQRADVPFPRKVLAVVLGVTFWMALSWGELPPARQGYIALAGLTLILLSSSRFSFKSWWPGVCLGIVISFHVADLVGHASFRSSPNIPFWNKFKFPREYSLNAITYPQTWKVKPEHNIPVPQYLEGAYNKKAVWANFFPNAMFWLQADFSRFLLQQRFLGRTDYFYPSTYVNLELKEAEGNLFYAMPAGNEASVDALSLQVLKQVLKVDRPFLEVVERKLEEDRGEGAEVTRSQLKKVSASEPDSTIQISLSIQNGFQPDRLEIQVFPWSQPWEGDHVELWESMDQRSWRFIQKLDIRDAIPDQPNKIWTFPLKRAITQKFVKLVIDRKHLNQMSGVNLVESGVQETGNESVILSGDGILVQKPSNNPNRVALDLNLPQDAWILRLENYHKNWTAALDGQKVPIQKVFPNFQAVFVKAGQHELTFQFESAYHGLVILHIVTAVLGALVFLAWLAGFEFGKPKEGFGRKGVGASAEA